MDSRAREIYQYSDMIFIGVGGYLGYNHWRYRTIICVQYHKKGQCHHIYLYIFLGSNTAILYLINQVKSMSSGSNCKKL